MDDYYDDFGDDFMDDDSMEDSFDDDFGSEDSLDDGGIEDEPTDDVCDNEFTMKDAVILGSAMGWAYEEGKRRKLEKEMNDKTDKKDDG